MSKASKKRSYQLTKGQWAAVGTTTAAGAAAGGAIGAAGVVIGMTACYAAANALGYSEGDQPKAEDL